jgi:hypothetical protein
MDGAIVARARIQVAMAFVISAGGSGAFVVPDGCAWADVERMLRHGDAEGVDGALRVLADANGVPGGLGFADVRSFPPGLLPSVARWAARIGAAGLVDAFVAASVPARIRPRLSEAGAAAVASVLWDGNEAHSVVDPCCGAGATLLRVTMSGPAGVEVVGLEEDPDMRAVAWAGLAAAGIDGAEVVGAACEGVYVRYDRVVSCVRDDVAEDVVDRARGLLLPGGVGVVVASEVAAARFAGAGLASEVVVLPPGSADGIAGRACAVVVRAAGGGGATSCGGTPGRG